MSIFLVSILVLVIFMTTLFVISLITKNNGVADVGYGVAFIVFATATLLQSPVFSPLIYALIACVYIWGIRLAVRIYLKNKGKPEDFRYRAWREAWGSTFILRSFFQIYILQGAIIAIISLPVLLSILAPASTPVTPLIYLGLALWVIGFLFESVADHQLDRFIKDPTNKGKIMMQGLWYYSRHPNYFGESLMWWGLALAGFGITGLLWVFLSPLLITFLLLKVSGVPMLEKRWKDNPEWEAYKAKTSVFIPLPVRE